MSEYNIVYLLCNTLRTYAIFKFMCIFFNRDDVNRIKEWSLYVAYYIITAGAYIFINVPIITTIINVIIMFIITLIYSDTYKKRIFAVLYMYAMLILVEFLAFGGLLSTGIIKNLLPNVQLIIMQIVTTMVTYMLVLALSNFKIFKNHEEVLPMQWVVSIIIPIITTILAIAPLLFKLNVEIPLLSLIIIAMFFVNIAIFYLYDELLKASQKHLENQLAIQQNTIYEKQMKLIYQSQENITMFRHDMKNHLYALRKLVENNDNQQAIYYINDTFDIISNTLEYCNSSNYTVDSILNFKISEAVNLGVKVFVHTKIPIELAINNFDLNIVLGNLMDNAINATVKATEKFIEINMSYERDVLFVDITNSYNGIIKEQQNNFISTHKNIHEHGIGIPSVKRVIKKYDGTIEFVYDQNKFKVVVMICNVNKCNRL